MLIPIVGGQHQVWPHTVHYFQHIHEIHDIYVALIICIHQWIYLWHQSVMQVVEWERREWVRELHQIHAPISGYRVWLVYTGLHENVTCLNHPLRLMPPRRRCRGRSQTARGAAACTTQSFSSWSLCRAPVDAQRPSHQGLSRIEESKSCEGTSMPPTSSLPLPPSFPFHPPAQALPSPSPPHLTCTHNITSGSYSGCSGLVCQ